MQAPSRASQSPAVIVCCSPTDTETVKPACDALRTRGYAVDELFGVAEEPELLAGAIRRHAGQGLYVLCRSDGLDRLVVDKLRAVLRSHEVPFGRTLTLAIEVGKPRVLEERIVSVLRRMVTGRPPPVPVAAGASSISDVRAAPPEEVVTGVDASEIAAWADSLTRGQRLADAERPTPSPRPSAYPVDGLDGGVDPTPGVSHPLDDLPPEVPFNDEAKTEPITSPGGASRPLQPIAGPGLRPVTPFVPAPGNTLDGGSAASIVDSRELDPGSPARNRFIAIGLTAIGAAVLIGLAFAFSGDDEPTQPVADAAPANESPAAAEALDPEPEPSAPERAAEAVPSAPAEPAPDQPSPEPAPARAKPTPDAPAVVRALQSRDVRALDTLIVTAERTKPRTYAAAQNHCERLVVGGLGGWRLPEIGELDAIGRADMLRAGIYWSDTFGDVHGDARMVFNTKRSRIGPVKTGWDGAHAVCVRLRS